MPCRVSSLVYSSALIKWLLYLCVIKAVINVLCFTYAVVLGKAICNLCCK